MKNTRYFPGLAKEMMERQRAAALERPAPSCERCGCTDAQACPGGCSWVRPGLCTSCMTIEEAVDAGLPIDGEEPDEGPMFI